LLWRIAAIALHRFDHSRAASDVVIAVITWTGDPRYHHH
jgi:hypothetical protein